MHDVLLNDSFGIRQTPFITSFELSVVVVGLQQGYRRFSHGFSINTNYGIQKQRTDGTKANERSAHTVIEIVSHKQAPISNTRSRWLFCAIQFIKQHNCNTNYRYIIQL